MIKKILPLLTRQNKTIVQQKAMADESRVYKDYLHREAVVGGQLFGPIPANHRREFFCLDERTWIWHEEWLDKAGKKNHRTTRYDIRPNGILKLQNGASYQQVVGDEADNFLAAIRLYKERVVSDIYYA